MVKQSKMTTVSVRVEEELLKKLDTVTSIIPINKSDFLRSCLEKLCDDNQILIDHHNKVGEYINFIKDKISKLPAEIITVKNGSWKEVKESTILILCDELWRTSKPIFNNWTKLLDKYGLEMREPIEESEGLLDLGSIVMLMVEKSGRVERPDISLMIQEEDWVDSIEIDRITLSYACKKTFEKQSAQTIIEDYLKKETERKKEGPQRLVIDAKGNIRRSGPWYYLPVDTEKISTGD